MFVEWLCHPCIWQTCHSTDRFGWASLDGPSTWSRPLYWSFALFQSSIQDPAKNNLVSVPRWLPQQSVREIDCWIFISIYENILNQSSNTKICLYKKNTKICKCTRCRFETILRPQSIKSKLTYSPFYKNIYILYFYILILFIINLF